DVHAQDAIGLRVSEDLHAPLGAADGLGATVGAERERALLVGDAGLAELLFAPAHGRDLRVRVDHARDRVVVHVAVAGGDDLDAGDALFLGLVRQHRAADHVPDRPDAGHVGAEVVVDDDVAPLALLHADLGQAEALGVRDAADGEQHAVALDRVLPVDLDHAARRRLPGGLDTRAQLEGEAL